MAGMEKVWAKQVKWQSDFIAALEQHQGKKSVVSVPVKVVDAVIRVFSQQGWIVKDNHQSMRFSNISSHRVLDALALLQLTKYNDAVHCIYAKLTGRWACDLQYIEKKLCQDFTAVLNVYLQLYAQQPTLTKSFLHSHYLLHQLLRHNKINVDTSFPISALKTMTKQMQQDHLCKMIFERLNWPFSPLF